MGPKFFDALIQLLYTADAIEWVATQLTKAPQSEYRRDLASLLTVLRRPTPDASAIGLAAAQVILSNNLRHARAATMQLP